MSDVRPVIGRELLLDNNIRASLRRKVDPLITRALNSRGYTEEQSPVGRVYLDSPNVAPSDAYLSIFDRIGFDGLSVATTYDVSPTERLLSRSTLNLNTVGGFAAAKIVSIGETYQIDIATTNEAADNASYNNVDSEIVSEILEDVKAHTPLGYSRADEPVSPLQIIREISALHSGHSVDRSAHFQMIPDDGYGDIRMNIGESFDIKRTGSAGHEQLRKLNTKKVFELTSQLPLEDGSVTLGVKYASGRRQSEVKLTAEIKGTNFSDKRKQAMYDQIVYEYQHRDPTKFGAGVISNLVRIVDGGSDIYRLG